MLCTLLGVFSFYGELQSWDEKNKFVLFIASLWCIKAVSGSVLPLAFQHKYPALNTWFCSRGLRRIDLTGQKYHNTRKQNVLFIPYSAPGMLCDSQKLLCFPLCWGSTSSLRFISPNFRCHPFKSRERNRCIWGVAHLAYLRCHLQLEKNYIIDPDTLYLVLKKMLRIGHKSHLWNKK